MAFKYPVGHVLAGSEAITPGGPGRGSFGAGAEPPGYIPGLSAGARQQVQPTEVLMAGASPLAMLGGGIPAVAGALGVAMPAWLLAALGVAGGAYAGYQALGGGEGGGLFGNNLLGGDEFTQGGLEFGGPGLPEPTADYTEWHSGNKQFYHVPQYSSSGKYAGAKIAMYNRDTKKWKVWRLPKPHLAVIGKNMPRHQMITRLRRNLSRHTADAKTILKLTSPNSLAKAQHKGHWAEKKVWHK